MKKIVVMGVLWLSLGGLAWAGEVRISAAASLAEALNAVAEGYRQAGKEGQPVFNFGASGTLAKQVHAGAPAHIFISADPKWLDFLNDDRLLATGTSSRLARNELVFVANPEVAAGSLTDLSGLGRIAIGSPDSVPAGNYARQALSAAGLFDALLAAGRLVYAKDVRQALMYVERGEVDGAFVYRTDALAAQRAVLRFVVDPNIYAPVVYPMALTVTGAANPDALAFFAYLQGAEARAVLTKHGFLVP